MSTVIGYIILTIGIGLTLYNIYATATLKKRNQANAAKYNLIFAPVENALLEKQKEYNCHFLDVTRIVTDREEPIVVVSDWKKKIAAVATQNLVEVFPFDSMKEAEIEKDESTNNVSVVLNLDDKTLTFPIATKGYRKSSMNRKLCLDMAGRFIEALDFTQPHGKEKKKKNGRRR